MGMSIRYSSSRNVRAPKEITRSNGFHVTCSNNLAINARELKNSHFMQINRGLHMKYFVLSWKSSDYLEKIVAISHHTKFVPEKLSSLLLHPIIQPIFEFSLLIVTHIALKKVSHMH